MTPESTPTTCGRVTVRLYADRTEVVADCDCGWKERFDDWTPEATVGAAVAKHREGHRDV